ncbi:MAG: 1-deoxy-D-xylulose-5-phosphate reductoisomerase [Propionibacteriaceae bacterium]|nr:1-deoxy-D-xylulose-5-phosphate reductoisomerase [Propionibacteriaceae bacterium]
MKSVLVLGSTGSIGSQAIELIRRHANRFKVIGLSAAGSNIKRLAEQITLVNPPRIALADERKVPELRRALARKRLPMPSVLTGPEAASDLARLGADIVLNAISGYAGLESTVVALQSGSRLALANKESLVVGGTLVKSLASPGQIVPVDSEHSAIAQCLRTGRSSEVSRLILTASGGPFRGWNRKSLSKVTVEQALSHPTWNMGRVITINSATMVNKGMELIEAGVLFGVDWDAIDVVVHPQSVVHSMVEFIDGATVAQCSPPDMALPIALGLSWPKRLSDVSNTFDWTRSASWTFEPVDNQTFPAVELARKVGRAGWTVPAVFNAANEVLVEAFCEHRIPFLAISDGLSIVVERYLASADWAATQAFAHTPAGRSRLSRLTVADIAQADDWGRAAANSLVNQVAEEDIQDSLPGMTGPMLRASRLSG